MGDSENTVTNLDRIPGREIIEIMGMVYGYVSVKRDGSGERYLETSDRKWPWAETPKHFEMLMKEGETRLRRSATERNADSVVGVEGRIQRGPNGDPEVVMMGTAVRTIQPRFTKVKEEKLPEIEEEEVAPSEQNEEVAITIGDLSATWKPLTAIPSEDTKGREIKRRGRGQRSGELSPMELAHSMGISTERASRLISEGYVTIEDIAKAKHDEVTRIEGINPTQARLIIKKARDLVDEKKG